MMTDEVNAAAVEPYQRAAWRRCGRPPGKSHEPLRRFLNIADRNDDIDEFANAVRMRQPARLPHRVLGVMRQYLDAAFRHCRRFDPGNGESRSVGAALGIDRTLHADEMAYWESSAGEA